MTTEKPHWAGYIWSDYRAIYLQLPDSGHICSFSFTEGGLSKALTLIRSNCGINGFEIKLPTPTKKAKAMPKSKQEKYRAVMKRLGML